MASLLDTPEVAPPPNQRMYQMFEDSKIPVSKHVGTVWKSRYDAAKKKRDDSKLLQAWQECIRYYQNDQSANKDRVIAGTPGSRVLSSRVIEGYAETENVVFANTVAATAAIYSKNPECECTTNNPELEQMMSLSERLINTILAKKEAPGVYFKPKARRGITSAFLCNLGWWEVGWIAKEDSTEQAILEIEKLSLELQNAKDTKEVQRIEGALMALDEKVNVLSEAGPFVKWRPAHHVLRDPQSVEEDLSDANYVFIEDYINTNYLKARYYREGKEGDESIYAPTNVIPAGGSSEGDLQDRINNFHIFEDSRDYKDLGFEDQVQYDAAKLTKVVYVWDKVTRRVYLFNSNHWKWPIWVWDDPYKLTTFFPTVPVYFYTSPTGGESKGEVSYYLDQQDALNYANSIMNSARAWAGTKVVYDQNRIKPDEINKMLFSNKREAIPLDVPDGLKVSDVMPQGVEHPALKFAQLFDKGSIYQSIDRMSVVSDVQRGAQFKTNTTNQAIQKYEQASATKFDMLLDQVEDAIGNVAYLLLQLCWQNMETDQVVGLLGSEATQWKKLTIEEIKHISVRVEGGSTQKPNSMGKKKEALEVGQVLGQFASVTPVAAVVALKVFERAFDEVVISDMEWQSIQQSLMGPPPGQEGNAPPGGGGGGGSALPPEVKAAYDQLVASGVPPEEAARQVQEQLGAS